MDPNANLEGQRRIVASINALIDDESRTIGETTAQLAQYAGRLAELVEALDGWLKGGGFLPADWRVNR